MSKTKKPLAVAATTTSGLKNEPSTVEQTVNGFASDYTGEDRPLQHDYLVAYAEGVNVPDDHAHFRWGVYDVALKVPVAGSDGTCFEGISRKGIGVVNPDHVASYWATIGALGWLAANAPDKDVDLFVDSRLVVQQVNNVWQCRTFYMLRLRDTAAALLALTNARLFWLPSEPEAREGVLSRVTYGDAFGEVIDGMGGFEQ